MEGMLKWILIGMAETETHIKRGEYD